MTDQHHDDERSTEAFERLRSSVEHTVDVEGSLTDLHRTPVAHSARRWAAAAVVVSAAAMVVAAVLVSGWADRAPSETVAADGSTADGAGPTEQDDPTESTPESTELDCGEPQLSVIMEPTVTPEQIEAVRTRLIELSPGVEWEYLDQAATYAEFQRLFADQPEFVESVSPDDLTTSFRGVPDGALSPLDVAALQQVPGVLRVEGTDNYVRACQQIMSSTGTGPTEQHDPAAPTSTSTALDCGEPQVFVYLEPTATPEQVEAARTRLVELSPGVEWEYLDQAATYAEFQRLFADSPEFVATVGPGQLPTSFRTVPQGVLSSLDAAQLEQIPGVLRVEYSGSAACDHPG